jgi:hypothetical protein
MGGEWMPVASPRPARLRGLETRLSGGLRGDRAEPDLAEPSRTQVVSLRLKKGYRVTFYASEPSRQKPSRHPGRTRQLGRVSPGGQLRGLSPRGRNPLSKMRLARRFQKWVEARL